MSDNDNRWTFTVDNGWVQKPDYARLSVLQAERTWLASEMVRLDISRTSEHEHANRLHKLNKAIKEGIGE